MAITDLIPWKRDKNQVDVRREDDSVLALRNEIDRVFDDFFNRPFGLQPWFDNEFRSLENFSPNTDISENDKEIRVTLELPGMDADDIDIELHDDYLTIRGEKKSENEEKDEHFHRIERSYGSFHRTVPLPSEIKSDNIDAKFKNGVLNIKLPKVKSGKSSKRIEIASG